jgi:hypothetical protein
MQNLKMIEKEEIPSFTFTKTEVLSNPDDVMKRQVNLEKAQTLGNGYRRKVKISFLTEEGPKSVDTTVWAATQEYVILKSGVTIPKRSILDVEL